MTSSATRSIEIDAPVEEVFAFVADPRRQTQAMARALGRHVTVSDVETSPDGVVRAGRGVRASWFRSPTRPR